MRISLSFLILFVSLSASAEVRVPFSDDITPKSLIRLEQNIEKAAAKILEGSERNVVLDLSSGGGDLFATMKFVSRVSEIAARLNVSIDTRVRSECDSACTVLFTAGTKRRANKWARFGFHSPAIASALPKGMRRSDVLEDARQRWVTAIAAVDGTLADELVRRKLLRDDDFTYLDGKDVFGGYVTDLE